MITAHFLFCCLETQRQPITDCGYTLSLLTSFLTTRLNKSAYYSVQRETLAHCLQFNGYYSHKSWKASRGIGQKWMHTVQRQATQWNKNVFCYFYSHKMYICVFKAFEIVWKFIKVPIVVFVCRQHIIFRYGDCRRILQKKDQRTNIYRLLATLPFDKGQEKTCCFDIASFI